METKTENVSGYIVTVEEITYGIWHYRISKGKAFYTGTITAWSDAEAIRKAMENVQ